MECFYILLTIIAATTFAHYFNIIVKKLSFLSSNIEVYIVVSIFILSVVSNVVHSNKFNFDNEVKFLRSLGYENWELRMIYLFNLRFQYYFQLTLVLACFIAVSSEFFLMFLAFYTLFVYFLLVCIEGLHNRNKNFVIIKDLMLGKKKFVFPKGLNMRFEKNKLMALIKNDLNIANKIIEIRLFLLIYFTFNVISIKSDYLSFNAISLLYIFLISMTLEKIYSRNREIKKLYSVLGIEFKSFFYSKLISQCIIALFPVLFFLSIKTVLGVISFKYLLLSIILNLLVSILLANYWISIFTRFWEGSNTFVITIFAFCMFIPVFVVIVPIALYKSSYEKWGGRY